jgi:hypothetical protein
VQNCGASPRKKNATEATPMGRKAGIASDGVRQMTIF